MLLGETSPSLALPPPRHQQAGRVSMPSSTLWGGPAEAAGCRVSVSQLFQPRTPGRAVPVSWVWAWDSGRCPGCEGTATVRRSQRPAAGPGLTLDLLEARVRCPRPLGLTDLCGPQTLMIRWKRNHVELERDPRETPKERAFPYPVSGVSEHTLPVILPLTCPNPPPPTRTLC